MNALFGVVLILNGLVGCRGCDISKEFQCRLFNSCIPLGALCDDSFDCGSNDLSDEDTCPSKGSCPEGIYNCNGQCQNTECSQLVLTTVVTSLYDLLSWSSSILSSSRVEFSPSIIYLSWSTPYSVAETQSPSLVLITEPSPSSGLSSLFSSFTTRELSTTESLYNTDISVLPLSLSSFSVSMSTSLTNMTIRESFATILSPQINDYSVMSTTDNLDETSMLMSDAMEIFSPISSVIEESLISSNISNEYLTMLTSNLSEEVSTSTIKSYIIATPTVSSSTLIAISSAMFTSSLIEYPSSILSSFLTEFSSEELTWKALTPTSIIATSYLISEYSSVLFPNTTESSSVSSANAIETSTMTLDSGIIGSSSISSSEVNDVPSASITTSLINESSQQLSTQPFDVSTPVALETLSTLSTSDRKESSISPYTTIKPSVEQSTYVIGTSIFVPNSSFLEDSFSTRLSNEIESTHAPSTGVKTPTASTTSIMYTTLELSTLKTESVTSSRIISTFKSTTPSTTTPTRGEVPVDVNDEDIIIMIAVLSAVVIIMIILSLIGWQLMGRRRAVDLHRVNGLNNNARQPDYTERSRSSLDAYKNEFPYLDFVHARRSSIPRPQSYTRITHNDLARHEEIELRPDYQNEHSHNDVNFY